MSLHGDIHSPDLQKGLYPGPKTVKIERAGGGGGEEGGQGGGPEECLCLTIRDWGHQESLKCTQRTTIGSLNTYHSWQSP